MVGMILRKNILYMATTKFTTLRHDIHEERRERKNIRS